MALLSVEDAIARIIAGVEPLPTEPVPLGAARGRRLAEPLSAKRTQPPFPASAMDGYALRASDATAGARLTVIGMAAAGHGFGGKVGPGEAVRIFTGAPVPEGADAILIQENAEPLDRDRIAVREPAAVGRHIRPAGLDFVKGATLLPAGRTIGMREAALAAAMGYAALPVRRRPRVAIAATGDELVPPGVTPGPDQIVASNGIGLAALVESIGGEAIDLGIVADERAALADTIGRARALPADVLITLGGASVGDHDLVQEALTKEGMALDFWKIAMRPGKPLMFGRLGAVRVLGLPGNPVSSLVCAILFLKPLVAALLGEPRRDPSEAATLGAGVPANDIRQDYVRATLAEGGDGLPVATAFSYQDSSMLAVLAQADCLIIRPPRAPAAPAGATCRIIRLP